MKLLFDEDLAEAVVFMAAAGPVCRGNANSGWPPIPSLQVRRFHGERERLYRVLDPDERNAAFFKLHLAWFREWGFEQFLSSAVAHYPVLTTELKAVGFRKARRGDEEGSELFVSSESGRHAVVALKTERFSDRDALSRFLRHELMHVRDMVAKEFGYSPTLDLRGPAASQQRLIRERYRILWDVTIDGRLTRDGVLLAETREKRFSEFARAYSFWAGEKKQQVFEALWNDDVPQHQRLMHLASDPRDLARSTAPLPGASCPLCDFPTFQWATAEALDHIEPLIRSEFQHWDRGQGVCHRCQETYEALAAYRSSVPA